MELSKIRDYGFELTESDSKSGYFGWSESPKH